MIEIKDLYKSFGDKKVLNGVNLTVKEGEVVSVIGGSGTGKSTLIKCIVRLIKPTSGKILIDSKDFTYTDDEFRLAAIRRKFGYLFQEGALFDSLSVGENVEFGLRYLTEEPKSKYKEIVKDKLALVGLKDVENMRPSELSGGMKKRVALARVLAVSPRYLLYDEPTSGLDPIMSDVVNELILDMKKKLNMTSVVITHDMKSAYKISDTIVFLYGGKVLMQGTPEEFKNTDNPYVRQFVDGTSNGPIKIN
ncbi:ABC transporter related [Elusimicrobium minutum Pei191]|uniref:ABC transporter related n=1 Tax=Elusimicrobium minutum (strain Pei191) TaxID=445932 RepID=B2KBY3_ELUMP|nr:ABC transporter ATP-binding protein [Elusimicrobium minutum]ACC97887.1 ABC transporter related [Elusimicrobium minutum Pei191]